MNNTTFDLVVIGSGPGGYVAAVRAAQLGLATACIEKEPALGGTCLNVGCIPSKALLQSSEHLAFIAKESKVHGIICPEVAFDFSQMMRRKQQVVTGLTNGVASLFKRHQIAIFKGTASLASPHEILINGPDGQKTIRGKQILLATGSEPIPLPFLPFDEQVVLSSTGALSLPQVPRKMLVIGAGVIGVELASVYQRLGSEVIIIEMLDGICLAMDETISKTLQRVLKSQGLVFHLGARVASAKVKEGGVEIDVQMSEVAQTYSADVVLVAIGRRPYTTALGLDAVGIKTSSKGFIPVDGNFRTSISHIYAIGDLIEGPMLAHRASDEGVAVAESLAGLSPRVNYAAIPNVIYTNPEAAGVGITEAEGKSFGLHLKIGTAYFKGNPRARCAGVSEGVVKIIGEERSGKLAGMHIIGPHASELIGEGVVGLEKGITLEELAKCSHAHPTFSEAIKEAAESALGWAIHG